MKNQKINASIIALFLFMSLSHAQIDLLNIESHNKGVLFPSMNITDRDAIQNPSSGMVIFNNQSGRLDYHDGISWKNLVGTGGPYGSQGPQGDPGQDILGPDGPDGVDGLQCWDLNGDRINDLIEDVDGNGIYNVNDCKGQQGPQGAQGLNNNTQGAPGATGFTGPRAGDVFTREVLTTGLTCLEFDEPTINTRPDFILIHQSRHNNTTFPTPNTHLSFQNGKWNVCANSPLALNTFYDIVVIGNLPF